MKRSSQIRYYAVVFAAGVLAGRFFVAGLLSNEAFGVVLQTAGAIAVVATSFLALGIRILDSEPPKEYSKHYADQFRRKMDHHRRIFWTRYGVALVSSIVGAAIGSILKIEHPPIDPGWLVGFGMGAGMLSLLVSVTAVLGYNAINRTLREVVRDADEMRRRNEIIGI